MKLILAHDLGTSGNKATLFSEDGRLLASQTCGYETVFRPGGIAEQDPRDWWNAVCRSTHALMRDYEAGQVMAIAFSGMMMGCLCIDRQGRPLRPHMLYCDQRATEQTERLIRRATADAVYNISGSPANAVNSGPKYMWVKEWEPEIYRQTHKVLNAKDYLNYLLTGRIATDPTDASGTNLYDLDAWQWSEALIEAAELDPAIFPEIVPSTEQLGELTREAAEAMGLRPSIPVMAGAADGMCAGVGAGSVAPGSAFCCVGSSAWVGITTREPLRDAKHRTITFAHAVPDLFQPLGTMLSGGSAYAWAAEALGQKDLARLENIDYHQLMFEASSASPPGANGLIFLPHLMGERTPHWNSLARAGFIGLTMTHTRGDMIRAVMEGVAMNLSATVDIFRDLGQTIDEIAMIGGAAKGPLWRQILADVYQADILRSNYLEEATSIGAAVIAGIGAGIYKDFSITSDFIRTVDRTAPERGSAAVYAHKKQLFASVYKALEPLFPGFAAAQE